MTTLDCKCTCGEIAVVFMDSNGDPLDESMCFDCYFYYEAMQDITNLGDEYND